MLNIRNNIRTAELNGLAESLLNEYDEVKNSLKDSFLEKYFQQARTLSEEFNLALKRSRLQSDLADKDSVRDEKIRTINSVLKGYVALPVPEMAEAAKRLSEIFGKYTVDIANCGYVEETGFIKSLLTDFDTQTAQADIKKLVGFDTAVADLKAAQLTFDQAYRAYEMAMGQEGTQPSATNIKKPLLSIFNDKILPYLGSMQAEEGYSFFVNGVEQIITDMNSNIASRGKKDAEPEVETKAEAAE